MRRNWPNRPRLELFVERLLFPFSPTSFAIAKPPATILKPGHPGLSALSSPSEVTLHSPGVAILGLPTHECLCAPLGTSSVSTLNTASRQGAFDTTPRCYDEPIAEMPHMRLTLLLHHAASANHYETRRSHRLQAKRGRLED
ncbi:uncharacterized protein N7498_007895 [Penicillium cinerascens]|uniref:Uncharacterized protein n=1 Tax=Penicillium cinerascens TaxID=70096 RepID=A0A9W9JKU2_9EURO|nr:uncharacterized protein N7498_007895 [Penicillium cinerascens]KAJ5198778.1 hypothetical protein N7498_007895 [Penicillium cinerascens]